MKITNVEAIHINPKLCARNANQKPRFSGIDTQTVFKITCDNGVVGWGDCRGHVEAKDQMERMVDRNPVDFLMANINPGLSGAIYDAVGKHLEVPAYKLIGEKVRDQVPVSYWSRPMEPHETAAEAEVGARLGFSCHKLKARPWNIVETVKLMKLAAGPDYTVGIDPNQKFRLVHIAARLAQELEPFGTVANFENPMLKKHLDWFRLLREKTHIPIALHANSPEEVLNAIKAESIDYVNLSGSALEIKKAAAIAEAADVPCWVQLGGLCLGVKAAYSVHLQATIANATLPCDELPFIRVADVLDEGLGLENGHFNVPQKPGLGVTLDMEVVEKYRVG